MHDAHTEEHPLIVEAGGISYVAAGDRHGDPINQFTIRCSPVLYLAPIFLGGAAIPKGLGLSGSLSAIIAANVLGGIAAGICAALGVAQVRPVLAEVSQQQLLLLDKLLLSDGFKHDDLLNELVDQFVEGEKSLRQSDLVAADPAAFEEKQRRDIVIPIEHRQDQVEDAQQCLATVLRLHRHRLDLAGKRTPRLIEDGLQQTALPAEISNELRLGRTGLSRDRGRRRLLVAVPRKERFAGGDEPFA